MVEGPGGGGMCVRGMDFTKGAELVMVESGARGVDGGVGVSGQGAVGFLISHGWVRHKVRERRKDRRRK